MSSVLDISLADYKSRLDEFAGEMQAEFHLPATNAEPLDANGAVLMAEEPDAKRSEQIVAHLQLLGYLPSGTERTRDEINAALEAWDRAFREAKARNAFEFSADFHAEKLEQIPWEEARIRYLKALATFEGEIAFTALPEHDVVTLESRVAHARLIAFGLSRVTGPASTSEQDRFAVGDAFSTASRAVAQIGGDLFFGRDDAPLELLNLLGSAPAATDAFLGRNAGLRFLFQGDSTGSSDSILRWGLDRQPTWEPRWEQTGRFWRPVAVAHDDEPLPALVDTGDDVPMDEAKLVAQSRLPLNVVALELLQLRLWTLGYYLGALDGAWGPITEEALTRFGAEHRDLLGPTEDYLAAGRNGWRAVNLVRILGTIVERFDLPAEALSTEEMTAISEQALGSLDAQSWQEVEANFHEHRARERQVISEPTFDAKRFSLETENPERTRYFGWRRFFAAAGVFVRGVADKIRSTARAIVDALRAGLGQAFEVVRFLWRKVRVAVRIARLAARRLYCWLTGSPIGTVIDTHCAVTWWSLDFDSVVFASFECPQIVFDRHFERLAWMSRSLNFMGELALFVISSIAKAAMGSWLAVAYAIFNFVRDLITNPEYRLVFSDDILERGTI